MDNDNMVVMTTKEILSRQLSQMSSHLWSSDRQTKKNNFYTWPLKILNHHNSTYRSPNNKFDKNLYTCLANNWQMIKIRDKMVDELKSKTATKSQDKQNSKKHSQVYLDPNDLNNYLSTKELKVRDILTKNVDAIYKAQNELLYCNCEKARCMHKSSKGMLNLFLQSLPDSESILDIQQMISGEFKSLFSPGIYLQGLGDRKTGLVNDKNSHIDSILENEMEEAIKELENEIESTFSSFMNDFFNFGNDNNKSSYSDQSQNNINQPTPKEIRNFRRRSSSSASSSSFQSIQRSSYYDYNKKVQINTEIISDDKGTRTIITENGKVVKDEYVKR